MAPHAYVVHIKLPRRRPVNYPSGELLQTRVILCILA
jgi:hypothetical protein